MSVEGHIKSLQNQRDVAVSRARCATNTQDRLAARIRAVALAGTVAAAIGGLLVLTLGG